MKENIIPIVIILIIIFLAVFYIIRAKKRGQKCIGCPYSKECAKKCCCNNQSEDKREENKFNKE